MARIIKTGMTALAGVAVIFSLTSRADAGDGEAYVLGLVSESCASWMQRWPVEDNWQSATGVAIGAAWTAINVSQADPKLRLTGEDTDGNGVVALVAAQCNKNPAESLMSAIGEAWDTEAQAEVARRSSQ